MRISQTGTCKQQSAISSQQSENKRLKTEKNSLCTVLCSLCSSSKAFTLIELVIVIFIISLTTALIMPSFWDSGERALKSEAKRISSTLRYVYDEAVGKKQAYIFKIDLDKSSWGFESEKESRSFQMEKDVTFKDVIIPSHGEISDGEVTMEFGPLGPGEPITVHLIKNQKEYTITFNHLNGRARILEGYIL